LPLFCHPDRKPKALGLCKQCYDQLRYSITDGRDIASETRKLVRLEVLIHYSPNEVLGCSCPGCDVTYEDFLGIDHIEGGGNKHIQSLGGGTAFYAWLKRNNFPLGYQTLCHNCNHAKSKPKNEGVCPHLRGIS
jgi:hypothetical protein